MAPTLSANGWLVENGMVVVSPVTGFQVDPGIGNACALQFTFWADRQDEAKGQPSLIQLVVSLDGIVALRQALENAEKTLKAQASGPLQ